ncbi:MAG: phosphomannomutase/phosphoglucomutase [Bacilli bacterium]|nr:phosphomannomutase/phosphoglucomutase [Bacilli bacterium]
MKINKSIFRAYDIRGIYPKDIDDEVAYVIGQAIGTKAIQMGKKSVLIGYDNRLSSVPISENLIKGVTSTGADVINLGLVTSPMYYYGRILLDNWIGMMITASHNPKEYNGFKLSFEEKGNALGDEILEFRDFIIQGDFIKGEVEGIEEKYDITEDYINLIKDSLDFGNRRVKVILDCGNGTGSIIADRLLNELPIDYKLLYAESDGNFPNHPADPSVYENMLDLKESVLENKYDIGLMIDADGDRIGVVDEKGDIISVDILMAIFYRHLNDSLKNRKALFDVKCSKSLTDELEKLDIEPIMNRTGNSYAYRAVQEKNIDFGGEYSGHLFFNDKFPGIDDGLYAGLRLVELLSQSDLDLSLFKKGINKYYSTPELKLEVTDRSKFSIIEDVKKYAKEKGYKSIDIDGIRVEWEDSWALVRASNTGPHITMRFEATTIERLEEVKEEFTLLLDKLKVSY